MNDVSRRTFLVGAGAATAGLLGACGTDSSTPPRSAASGGGFPVRLTDAFGTVTVERAPVRVACVGRTDHDAVLALGVEPVSVYRFVPPMTRGVGAWAESALGAAKPAIVTQPLDYERIAALRPDLILDVQSTGDANEHRTLAGIATTLGRPSGTAANAVPWQRATEFIATALGRAAQGRAAVSRVETLLRQRAGANPVFRSADAAVILVYGDEVGVYSASDTRMQLLAGLGLRAAPFVAGLDRSKYFHPVSAERLGDVSADVVLVLDQQGRAPAEVRAELPALGLVPGARTGRVVYVADFDVSLALACTSVLSIPFAVRSLEPLLRGALT